MTTATDKDILAGAINFKETSTKVMSLSIDDEDAELAEGDCFDGDTGEYLGMLERPSNQPMNEDTPLILHVYIGGWWFNYKLDNKEKHEQTKS